MTDPNPSAGHVAYTGLGPSVTAGGDVEATVLDGNRAQQRAAVKPFVRAHRVFTIDFDADDLAGFEVKARSVSIGQFLHLMKLATSLDPARTTKDFSDEDMAAVETMFTLFADALVSWNLHAPDPDGGPPIPVPATYEALMAQDPDLMFHLIDGWMTAVGGVAAPLGATSSAGAPSPAVPIPMVAPSPSPPT
jgi:hypothetical protein